MSLRGVVTVGRLVFQVNISGSVNYNKYYCVLMGSVGNKACDTAQYSVCRVK